MPAISKRPEQVFGGVMLIGIGILFLTDYWWPGIVLVVSIATLARDKTEGRRIIANRVALGLLGLGLVFVVTDVLLASNYSVLAIIMIVLGLMMLFGEKLRLGFLEAVEKRKNEEIAQE